MQRNIIYSKKFKSLSEEIEELTKEVELETVGTKQREQFLEKLFSEKEYKPLEEKIAAANKIIQSIIKLANEYEIDIDIIQEHGSVYVKLHMDDCMMEGHLKNCIAEYMNKCDRFFLWTQLEIERDCIFEFEFITHEIQ